MSMIDNIVQWSESVPDWQADAIRRMLTQDELTQADKDELYLMLESLYGILPSGTTAAKPVRPKLGEVSGSPSRTESIALHAVEEVCGVNAIPDNSRLPFGQAGLTIIYGVNGSGKTGYARILKRACKARDTKERVLPNVFAAGSSGAPRPATAAIRVKLGAGEPQQLRWSDGQPAPDVLANVAVFDSRCARIIVDDACEVSYLPYGADVFRRLGDLLVEFKQKLRADAPVPATLRIVGVVDGTSSDAFLRGLCGTTSGDAVDIACAWSKDDEKRLGEVGALIAHDPLVLASQVDTRRKRAERLRSEIDAYEAVASDASLARLRGLRLALHGARRAADILARSLAGEPLPGVGTQPWRILYEAAAEYSTKAAYLGVDFPVVGEEARCVLCMQHLTSEARERLTRFRDFMQNKTNSAVAKAQQELDSALLVIKQAKAPTPADYVDVVETLQQVDSTLSATVSQYLESSVARLAAMKSDLSGESGEALPPLPASPSGSLSKVAQGLEAEAAGLLKDADPEARTKLNAEYRELTSRKVLADSAAFIRGHVQELARRDRFIQCSDSLKTLEVTNKGKAMVTETMTPALTTRLESELTDLGAAYIPITPAAKAAAGTTCYQMSLGGAGRASKVDISDVLSEGEQRVVAIAGFLAELAASGHTGPIVLDDPVCSLDHVFRRDVANRIAKEAQCRQVVVFTHDLVFLAALLSASPSFKVEPVVRTVYRDRMSPGRVVEDVPWEALSAGKRVGYLRKRAAKLRGASVQNPRDLADNLAQLYALLRETWEHLVADVLLAGVVQRYSPAVQTQKLHSVEVTDDDYLAVWTNMSRCSELMAGHTATLEAGKPAATLDGFDKDLAALDDYMKRLNIRATELKKSRKAKVDPHPA